MYARRDFLKTAGAASLLPLFSARAFALDYPNRSVRWVVSSAAGGSGDVVSRLIGQSLSARLGQNFIMDNRPGAGVNIATEAVVKAPADGYTLMILHKGNVVARMLYKHLEYDFTRDIQPVAGVMRAPLVMLVHPDLPAKSLPEFIAYAKANPSKINYGSAGIGSDPHLAGELFKMKAGVDIAHVPYRGGALALADLLAGHIQVMFSNLPAQSYITTGKLRALGVTTATRSEQYPDLPAIAETVPGYETSVWFCVGAHANTPAEIVEKLNHEIGLTLADPKVMAGLAVLGGSPMPLSPAQIKTFFAQEADKWAEVIRVAGIEPE